MDQLVHAIEQAAERRHMDQVVHAIEQATERRHMDQQVLSNAD